MIHGLHAADHHFVAIKEPFAAAIRVAINADKAAVERQPKHFDHRALSVQKLRDRPISLLDTYPIPAIKCVLLWCGRIHRLLSFT